MLKLITLFEKCFRCCWRQHIIRRRDNHNNYRIPKIICRCDVIIADTNNYL